MVRPGRGTGYSPKLDQSRKVEKTRPLRQIFISALSKYLLWKTYIAFWARQNLVQEFGNEPRCLQWGSWLQQPGPKDPAGERLCPGHPREQGGRGWQHHQRLQTGHWEMCSQDNDGKSLFTCLYNGCAKKHIIALHRFLGKESCAWQPPAPLWTVWRRRERSGRPGWGQPSASPLWLLPFFSSLLCILAGPGLKEQWR